MGAISPCARQLNCFRHQSYSLSLDGLLCTHPHLQQRGHPKALLSLSLLSQHVGTAYLLLRGATPLSFSLVHVSLMTNTAVGYVQLTHLVDDQEQLHVLITGLGVEEAFRRRGFGRAMLLHVIASVPAKEIWVEVQEDNRPAMKLYIECGFVVRRKQETLARRISLP
ncbi:hypothetical protein EDC04DRAFT_408010 [Pisolithus marmoratus]|nr:hypothetical protein EDC04DRAFT_408010 [Pisolithus marmoratus]